MRTSHLLPVLIVVLLGLTGVICSQTRDAASVPSSIFDMPTRVILDSLASRDLLMSGSARLLLQAYLWDYPEHRGVLSLKSPRDASLFYAVVGMNNPMDVLFWSDSAHTLVGENFYEPGFVTPVRRVSRHQGDTPGIILSGMSDMFDPFIFAPEHADYSIQFYGRLLEPVKVDTVLLNVVVTWMDGHGRYHQAVWEEGAESGRLRTSDFADRWNLSQPKTFFVHNSNGDPVYAEGDLVITWTGAADLEIYYLLISDSKSDSPLMVYP
jgi:hypothetical protein